jgi:O-antigen/teichoic acid export membrane protein
LEINQVQEGIAEMDSVAIETMVEAQPDQNQRNLESTALRATFWTVMNYGAAMVLRVLNSLVLTRLLLPESFGMLTLVTPFVTGISLLSDIGLTPSVIRSPRGDDPLFLNTAYTVQAIRGVGIFVISLLLTWPLTWFYHEPRLLWLFPVLAFNSAISAFNSTNLLTMSRHMGVRRQFVFDMITQVAGMIVTIAWAWLYPSVWALVSGAVVAAFFRLGLSHNRRLFPGIRNGFAWDRDCIHELVHFGKWIFLSTGFFFFASQSDRLILGKLIPMSLLGIYGIAYTVSDIPRQVINAFTQRVGYPFIAKMAHKPVAEFHQVFLHYRMRILLVGGVLLALTVHLGNFAVTHAYRHNYAAAGWMVPILALGLWHTVLYSTTMQALFSLGKSQYSAIGNGVYAVAVLLGIPIGFHFFGMGGAVVAVAAGDFPLYVVTTIGASREKITVWRQDLLTTLAFVAMLGIGLGMRLTIAKLF